MKPSKITRPDSACQERRDRDVLRHLAEQVVGLAQHPRETEKIRLWNAHNGLRPERPMLSIDITCWSEFETTVDELRAVCVDADCRDIEMELRRRLYMARHLPCDVSVEGIWWVPKVIEGADYGLPQSHAARIEQGVSGVAAQAFTPVICDEADIKKIRWPEVRENADATARRVAFAEGLFGDILPVRACGVRDLFYKGWDWLVRRTGVTEALMDMAARPDYVHALIGRLTEVTLARVDQLEKAGLLDSPHPCPWLPPGPAGYTDELPQPDADPARYRPMDLWGGASPQIFGEVSPEMHMEFGLHYENQVMSRCGLNYYGCCEPLHNKMDILATIPRLRKVSISPWCDVARAAANARQTYVFSHKPNPSLFAWDSFDLQACEKDLRQRLRASGPMPCEFVMKDISTVRGDARRLMDWCQMAWRFVNDTQNKTV